MVITVKKLYYETNYLFGLVSSSVVHPCGVLMLLG